MTAPATVSLRPRLDEKFQVEEYVSGHAGTAGFVDVYLSDDVIVTVRTAAQAREFVRAFALALELLTPGRVHLTRGEGRQFMEALAGEYSARDEPDPGMAAVSASDGEVFCGEKERAGWECTLPIGHRGDHVAHGGSEAEGYQPLATWTTPDLAAVPDVGIPGATA